MVTCCFCEPELTYSVSTFVQDLNEFMFYSTPAWTCVVLWKIFVTNRRTPRGDITVLGLDASARTYSPTVERGVSGWRVVLYLLTSILTFTLGVLAFAGVQALS